MILGFNVGEFVKWLSRRSSSDSAIRSSTNSWPLVLFLNHIYVLWHWAKYFYLVELFRKALTTPFNYLLNPIPSGLCLVEQRVKCMYSTDCQACLVMLRLQLSFFFILFVPILHLRVHAYIKKIQILEI